MTFLSVRTINSHQVGKISINAHEDMTTAITVLHSINKTLPIHPTHTHLFRCAVTHRHTKSNSVNGVGNSYINMNYNKQKLCLGDVQRERQADRQAEADVAYRDDLQT